MVGKTGGGLPEYESPPVVEVAVTTQFDTPRLSTPQIMLWWTQLRERFPKIEEAPAIQSRLESFEPSLISRPRVEFQLLDAPPAQRFLMVDSSGTGLLQIQQDRIGYSWRKLEPSHEYPRYARIREKFRAEFLALAGFLTKEKLDMLVPTQCDVTYVNHIRGESLWKQHGELHKVIPSLTPQHAKGFLPLPEDVRMTSRYVMPDADGRPLARLYVEVEPRYLTSTKEPIFLMRLTARGAPQGGGLEGVLRTMDLGHEWIVRGFTTLTSPEMQKEWRRTR